ncbi:MAG: DNA polymerase IV [Chloroflexota bacterium]
MTGHESTPWIIHADLDAFFATVAILRNPELAGKPVIVGGSPTGRGVVASASYEARQFGIHSAMPAAQAVRLCPHAEFVKVPGEVIRDYAARFRDILAEFSPVVEVVSVDEAYLDASESGRLFGGAIELARALKERVRDELGLVVSLGIGSNRLVAKIASDLGKPDGFTIVPHGHEAATFAPLPVQRLPGIGPKTAEALHSIGIRTLGELATTPERLLRSVVGSHAARLQGRARGESDKPVRGDNAQRKSRGHERTFGRDRRGLDELRAPLFELCERTGAELRGQDLAAGVIALKLRYSDFETISRQVSLPEPTSAHQVIFDRALELLSGALRERNAPVRLIGVRGAGLVHEAMQLELFGDQRIRQRNLNNSIDRLSDRYGKPLLRPASVGFLDDVNLGTIENTLRKGGTRDDPATV